MTHIISIWKELVEWFFWLINLEFLVGERRLGPPLWKEMLIRLSVTGGAAFLLYHTIQYYGSRIYVP